MPTSDFWAYEYIDFYPSGVRTSMEFDRYIFPENGLTATEFRLLETENRPVLPYSSMTQMLISRVDVLYSPTIPRLEGKADANPGRVSWRDNRFVIYTYICICMMYIYIVKPIGVGRKGEGANFLIGPQVLGPIKVNSLPHYQPLQKKLEINYFTFLGAYSPKLSPCTIAIIT